MNKIIGITTILALVTLPVVAQTKTLSPSPEITKIEPTKSTAEKNIEILKEKIANKVDELRSQSKQITVGTITTIKGSSIELTTDDSKTFTITIDDSLTKTYDIVKNQKKEIEATALKKGDYILVSGPAVESAITANEIYRDNVYIVSSGQITSIDKEAFTVDVVTPDKEELTLDIETGTKQQIMDIKTLELSKTGFSKFKTGDTIHFVAQKKSDSKIKTLSTIRILIIPQEYF